MLIFAPGQAVKISDGVHVTRMCLTAHTGLEGLPDIEESQIDPAYSFAGHVHNMSPTELQDLIEKSTFGMDGDHPLVRALHRGIGVHHSGLPTKYRQLVEILFRCRHLRVVIATGDFCLHQWQL